MEGLQSANERERKYIFIAVENLGEMVLEVANVRLEVALCLILTVRRW